MMKSLTKQNQSTKINFESNGIRARKHVFASIRHATCANAQIVQTFINF